MRASLPFTCLLSLALPTSADAQSAANWKIDRPRSTIDFVALQSGQSFTGSFRRFDAKIAFDPARLTASSVVAIIDTASATTGDATRDSALPSDDWFAAKLFPRAIFVAKSFQKVGANRYVAHGSLTIRNVSRPINLPFQLTIKGNAALMQGSLTLDRRWFGVGQGEYAKVDVVAGAVRVNVTIRAHQ